jgi:hypothetical protein
MASTAALVRQAAVVAAVDGDAALLVGVPVLPAVVVEVLAVDMHHLRDRQPYFSAKAKSRSSCAGTPITAPSP